MYKSKKLDDFILFETIQQSIWMSYANFWKNIVGTVLLVKMRKVSNTCAYLLTNQH